MTHWKHRATRCAMDGCERTRRKGWTTCALIGHAERGVSLYGLKRDEPRLLPPVERTVTRNPTDTVTL